MATPHDPILVQVFIPDDWIDGDERRGLVETTQTILADQIGGDKSRFQVMPFRFDARGNKTSYVALVTLATPPEQPMPGKELTIADAILNDNGWLKDLAANGGEGRKAVLVQLNGRSAEAG